MVKVKQLLRTKEGLTLVELAIGLAIASVVAMLAIPTLVGVLPRLRLSNDTVTLANEIALARARAISKNHEFRIAFNTASDSYTLRNETEGVDFARNDTSGDVDLYLVEELNAAATLAVQPVGAVGRVNAGSFENLPIDVEARIYLKTTDNAHRKRVVVQPSGRISVERWTGGTNWTED